MHSHVPKQRKRKHMAGERAVLEFKKRENEYEKREQDSGVVTFYLQLRHVPDLGSRVGGYARIISRVSGSKARNAQEARIRVKSRHVHSQVRGNRAAIFEPSDGERGIASAHATHRAGAHAFGKPVLEGKRLNYRRNWKN